MGHHSFEDNSHKKHRKCRPKPPPTPPSPPDGGVLVQGVLLSQTFVTNPLSLTINDGSLLHTMVYDQVGVATVDCSFSIVNQGTASEITLNVIRGPDDDYLTTSVTSLAAQSATQVSIFWSGTVSPGDIINIIGISYGAAVSTSTFKTSSMLYSIPQF